MSGGGGDGIRTHDDQRPCRFSRPVRSTRLRHPSAQRAATAAAAVTLPRGPGRVLAADVVEYSS
jgi:hypothetical protein